MDKEGGLLSSQRPPKKTQPLNSRHLDTRKMRVSTFSLFLQKWGKSGNRNAHSQIGKLRPDKANLTQVTQKVIPDKLPFISTPPPPDSTLKPKERIFPDPCRQSVGLREVPAVAHVRVDSGLQDLKEGQGPRKQHR